MRRRPVGHGGRSRGGQARAAAAVAETFGFPLALMSPWSCSSSSRRGSTIAIPSCAPRPHDRRPRPSPVRGGGRPVTHAPRRAPTIRRPQRPDGLPARPARRDGAPIVVTWAIVRPEALGIPLDSLLALTVAYLAISVVGGVGCGAATGSFGYAMLSVPAPARRPVPRRRDVRDRWHAEPDPLPRLPPPRRGLAAGVLPDRAEDRAVAFAAAVRRPVRPGRPARAGGRRQPGRRASSSTGCRSSTSPRSGCSRSRHRSSPR